MKPFFSSLGMFARGIFVRFYYWAVFLLLDVPDLYQRLTDRQLLPPAWSEQMSDLFPYLLVLGLGLAALLTYKEEHTKSQSLAVQLREKRHKEAGIRAIGRFRSFGISKLWANRPQTIAEYDNVWFPRL